MFFTFRAMFNISRRKYCMVDIQIAPSANISVMKGVIQTFQNKGCMKIHVLL